MPLTGRACIVTGAGRGIGRAIALRLSAAGASVLAAARTALELEETVSESLTNPGPCQAQVADVTKLEDIEKLIARCLSEYGRLDALINNAGVAPLAPIEEMSDLMFEKLIEVNVKSVFRACRAAWPALKDTGGTIINISSLAADDPFPGFAAYGGTKAFVNTFTRALANEGRPHGIRVFAVAPGAVETKALRTPFPDFPADQVLQPDQVAAVVEVLLDERCRYASGEIIRVKR